MSKYPDPFLDYLRVKFPPDGMIVPEPEDYRGWQAGSDSPDAEIARHYRLAQAKRMFRIYEKWRAEHN